MSRATNFISIKFVALFILGFVGILSSAPLIPQLLDLSPVPMQMPIFLVQVISVLQSSFLLLLMLVLGAVFARKVNLTTPVLDYWLKQTNERPIAKDILMPAILGGVLGGLSLLVFYFLMSGFLPTDFLESGQRFAAPWYTRLLYGGITEEILVRWGLMSFFTWVCYKVCQARDSKIAVFNYIFGIVLAALVFGLLHLPVALMLTESPNLYFYLYIIFGNGLFGCIAGWLFYKHGLESAILAHMIAHITMLIFG